MRHIYYILKTLDYTVYPIVFNILTLIMLTQNSIIKNFPSFIVQNLGPESHLVVLVISAYSWFCAQVSHCDQYMQGKGLFSSPNLGFYAFVDFYLPVLFLEIALLENAGMS